jgi:hypothetical protein
MPKTKKKLSVEDRVLKYVKKYMVGVSDINNFLLGEALTTMVGKYLDHLEEKGESKVVIGKNIMRDMMIMKSTKKIETTFFYTHYQRCIDAKEVRADAGKGGKVQLRHSGDARKVRGRD